MYYMFFQYSKLNKKIILNVMNNNNKKRQALNTVHNVLEKKYRNQEARLAAAGRIPRLPRSIPGLEEMRNFHASRRPPSPPPMEKGGKVPKSGVYKLHKGEVVVPASRVKSVQNALKDAGKKPLSMKCKTCLLSSKKLSKRRLEKY